MQLQCGRFSLDLSQPRVMGILNVTPDSFSDGGRFFDRGRAVEHALQLVEEGADMLDIGGESTRPGAEPVPEAEELRRVLPVLEALVPEVNVPISVDTSKPAVMRAAAEAGASMLNDVYALRQPGAVEAAAATGLPICLMHMLGEPRTMQADPRYTDLLGEIGDFLRARAAAAEAGGIRHERIVLDPGFGFGKTQAHNLQLLRELGKLGELGYPLLVGMSRKTMLGRILGGAPPAERVNASVAAAVLAVWQGAAIVRVHDVRPTVEALRVCAAVGGGVLADT